MAIDMHPVGNCDLEELQQALATATFELNYERSKRVVETVAREEDIRKLRFQILLLEDENEELHSQLEQEQEHGDRLAQKSDDALLRAEELDAEAVRIANELRFRTRELETTRTELLSLENMSADSSKLLTEKLALARELSALKPELEHLKSQISTNQNLLAEKLSLQRQLNAAEVELDNERRTKLRLQEKSSKKSLDRRQDVEEHEAEMDDLKRNLSEEKALHRETRKDVERLQQELQEERSKAKSFKASAQTAKVESDLVEELRRGLAKERQEREKVQQQISAADKNESEELETLRKDLAKEKKEREKSDKDLRRAQIEWEAQKELTDDKLSQFRTKLRATKDKLKAMEEELGKAQSVAANVRAIQDFNGKPGPKNTRKREADPDAALGTPGDGPQAKRGKRAQSIVGEKSGFSMTPFLKRQSSISITSPFNERPQQESSDNEGSPAASAGKKSMKPVAKSKVLGPAASSKTNSKAGAKSKKPVTVLEQVAEEDMPPVTAVTDSTDGEPGAVEQENQPLASKTTTTTIGLEKPVPKLKPSSAATKKPRKSIHMFASFATEPEPEKKRKRKLGQGFGSTLFDEADDEDRPSKPIPGRGLFAGRALAAMGKGKRGKALITAPDGFQFSPLKRERRAGSVQPSFVA